MFLRLQNLPGAANSMDIRRFFHDCDIPAGAIQIVGGPNDEAYIWFTTKTDLVVALARNGQHILGEPVRLVLALEGDETDDSVAMAAGIQKPEDQPWKFNELPTTTIGKMQEAEKHDGQGQSGFTPTQHPIIEVSTNAPSRENWPDSVPPWFRVDNIGTADTLRYDDTGRDDIGSEHSVAMAADILTPKDQQWEYKELPTTTVGKIQEAEKHGGQGQICSMPTQHPIIEVPTNAPLPESWPDSVPPWLRVDKLDTADTLRHNDPNRDDIGSKQPQSFPNDPKRRMYGTSFVVGSTCTDVWQQNESDKVSGIKCKAIKTSSEAGRDDRDNSKSSKEHLSHKGRHHDDRVYTGEGKGSRKHRHVKDGDRTSIEKGKKLDHCSNMDSGYRHNDRRDYNAQHISKEHCYSGHGKNNGCNRIRDDRDCNVLHDRRDDGDERRRVKRHHDELHYNNRHCDGNKYGKRHIGEKGRFDKSSDENLKDHFKKEHNERREQKTSVKGDYKDKNWHGMHPDKKLYDERCLDKHSDGRKVKTGEGSKQEPSHIGEKGRFDKSSDENLQDHFKKEHNERREQKTSVKGDYKDKNWHGMHPDKKLYDERCLDKHSDGRKVKTGEGSKQKPSHIGEKGRFDKSSDENLQDHFRKEHNERCEQKTFVKGDHKDKNWHEMHPDEQLYDERWLDGHNDGRQVKTGEGSKQKPSRFSDLNPKVSSNDQTSALVSPSALVSVQCLPEYVLKQEEEILERDIVTVKKEIVNISQALNVTGQSLNQLRHQSLNIDRVLPAYLKNMRFSLCLKDIESDTSGFGCPPSAVGVWNQYPEAVGVIFAYHSWTRNVAIIVYGNDLDRARTLVNDERAFTISVKDARNELFEVMRGGGPICFTVTEGMQELLTDAEAHSLGIQKLTEPITAQKNYANVWYLQLATIASADVWEQLGGPSGKVSEIIFVLKSLEDGSTSTTSVFVAFPNWQDLDNALKTCPSWNFCTKSYTYMYLCSLAKSHHIQARSIDAYACGAEHSAPTYSAENNAHTHSVEHSAPTHSAGHSAPTHSAEHSAPTHSAEHSAPTCGAEHSAPTYSAENNAHAHSVEHSAPTHSAGHSAPTHSAEHSAPTYSAEHSCIDDVSEQMHSNPVPTQMVTTKNTQGLKLPQKNQLGTSAKIASQASTTQPVKKSAKAIFFENQRKRELNRLGQTCYIPFPTQTMTTQKNKFPQANQLGSSVNIDSQALTASQRKNRKRRLKMARSRCPTYIGGNQIYLK